MPGSGTMPKSSPNAFLMPGIAHKPHHCIAVRPWMNADGSNQSVGAPSSSDLLVYSSRIFFRPSTVAGVSKATLWSAVSSSLPVAQTSGLARMSLPPSGRGTGP